MCYMSNARFPFFALMAGLACLFCNGSSARAGSVLAELWLNSSNAYNASIANTPTTTPDAEFNPTGINYDSRLTGYSIGDFLKSPTFFNTSAAWAANGGAKASVDNTFFLFTGTTYLNAGGNTFQTEHDDGFELAVTGAYSDSSFKTPFDYKQPGPTAPVLSTYTVYAPTAGLYSFTLSYGEVDGPPAVLTYAINGAPVGNTTVPEPGSLLLLGQGAVALIGLAWRSRRRFLTAAA